MEDWKTVKSPGVGLEAYDEAKAICHELNSYNEGKGWHGRADWVVVNTPAGPYGWHLATWGDEEKAAGDPLDVRLMDILSPSLKSFFLLNGDARALVLGWKAEQRLELIESKIKRIVTEEYDNICWMDIYQELAAFVGIEFDPKMLPRETMLKNCEQFVDSLLHATQYQPAVSLGLSPLWDFAPAACRMTAELRAGPVLEYITEEVSRQGHDVTIADGMIRVDWMWDAWQWARMVRSSINSRWPTISHVRELGRMVEREKNAEGFRSCGVRVGDRVCCRPEDVLPRLVRLWERIEDVHPDKELDFPHPVPSRGAMRAIEFYKEFELIHPFRDGNGRVGKILLNWLNDTLDNPIFPRNDLWGGPIRNP